MIASWFWTCITWFHFVVLCLLWVLNPSLHVNRNWSLLYIEVVVVNLVNQFHIRKVGQQGLPYYCIVYELMILLPRQNVWVDDFNSLSESMFVFCLNALRWPLISHLYLNRKYLGHLIYRKINNTVLTINFKNVVLYFLKLISIWWDKNIFNEIESGWLDWASI